MKIFEFEQGSTEWIAARLGIMTASQASRLIQPAKLKPSTQATAYIAEKLAEAILKRPLDDAASLWMDRGTEMEDEARSWYGFTKGFEVRSVGFCTTDEETFGCSPDGLLDDEGGLEIKVPSAAKHALYLMDPKAFEKAYFTQVQASLWVTGRDWWDLMSFNPEMPAVIRRQTPDEGFFAAFPPIVDAAFAILAEHKKRYGVE